MGTEIREVMYKIKSVVPGTYNRPITRGIRHP